MRAAQYIPSTGSVQINDIPIPIIENESEILVKISSASLCHTDIAMRGLIDPKGPPVTMGHEGVGIVEKIGSGVKGFKEGDRIGFLYFRGACFQCEGCAVHHQQCATGKQQLQGFACDGFFAEYALVDYHNSIILPKELDIKTAAPLFCAGITAFHAVDSCELRAGDWIAVAGCGGVGQYAIQYAKAMQYKVAALDINDSVLQQAKDFGADITFNTLTSSTYVEDLKKATTGGVHAAAIFSGAKAAYANGPKILRVNGILMVVGVLAEPLQVNVMDLIIGNYRVKAESTSTPQRMQRAVEFTARHKIEPKVSFHKLEDINTMIHLMETGSSTGRMVVIF